MSRAWDSVTDNTIKNCWQKAGILPIYGEGSDNENEINMDDRENRVDAEIYREHLKELEEVQVLIDKLDFENPLTSDEFIQCDKSETTTEMISDEEILKAVLPNDQEKEPEEVPLPKITHNDAIDSYDKVILYLEQQEGDFDAKKEDLKLVKRLRKEALRKRFISARQIHIDGFINVE